MTLSLNDIVDLREYERERAVFRSEVIALKKLRRVSLGPILTLVFENAKTIRFQIQEMARAEKMTSDEAIETELAIYNALIPNVNELSATMFIELVTKDELIEWLPKLVGIEESLVLVIEHDGARFEVYSTSEEAHKQNLTRNEITASVHYIKFVLSPEASNALRFGEAKIESRHHNYLQSAVLMRESIDSLVNDWG